MSEQTGKMTVHEAIAYVIREADAVGKSRKNEQQGYKFRGIEDVYNALSPAFGASGLYTRPVVTNRTQSERTTKTGAVQFHVVLTVDFYFTGPAGDSVVATVIGEAMDTGDKASNKAMSAAHKYALTQMLCLKFAEVEDGDRVSPEPTAPKNQPVSSVDLSSKTGVEPKSEALNVDVEKTIAGFMSRVGGLDKPEDFKAFLAEVQAFKKLAPKAQDREDFAALQLAYTTQVKAKKEANKTSG